MYELWDDASEPRDDEPEPELAHDEEDEVGELGAGESSGVDGKDSDIERRVSSAGSSEAGMGSASWSVRRTRAMPLSGPSVTIAFG